MQVKDAEEFCVPQGILGDGPERLHARPWPTDYVEAFQSLRIATDRVKKARSDLDELITSGGGIETSLRPPNDEAPSTMHTRRSVVDICRSSTYARNALDLSNHVKNAGVPLSKPPGVPTKCGGFAERRRNWNAPVARWPRPIRRGRDGPERLRASGKERACNLPLFRLGLVP